MYNLYCGVIHTLDSESHVVDIVRDETAEDGQYHDGLDAMLTSKDPVHVNVDVLVGYAEVAHLEEAVDEHDGEQHEDDGVEDGVGVRDPPGHAQREKGWKQEDEDHVTRDAMEVTVAREVGSLELSPTGLRLT